VKFYTDGLAKLVVPCTKICFSVSFGAPDWSCKKWHATCMKLVEKRSRYEAVTPEKNICSLKAWQRTISDTYYQRDVRAQAGLPFEARIAVIDLGGVSLSRIVSSPVVYHRRTEQISAQTESYHLVTIPVAGGLIFDQEDLRFYCPTNGLLMERGDLPYKLHQPDKNELVVLKISHALLDTHLPHGIAFTGQTIAPLGLAGLFVDFVRSSISHADDIEPFQYANLRRQILDLLVLTLTSRESGFEGAETSVQEAHLRRIKAAIRNRLFDHGLSPSRIAAECGLSVGYLHRLFAATGTTIGHWIREERLLASDRALRNPRYRGSLAAVAQQFGFSDQPQFCRHYKQRFGQTPSETRAEARAVTIARADKASVVELLR
jgi:AraC-like DNA-binding protein